MFARTETTVAARSTLLLAAALAGAGLADTAEARPTSAWWSARSSTTP